MAAKCDVKRLMTKREQQGDLSAIVEESFQNCPNERKHIVIGEWGRIGLCPDHLMEYHAYRKDNEGKPTAEKRPWVRLRNGIMWMGDEVPKAGP